MNRPTETKHARLGIILARYLTLFSAMSLFAMMWLTVADVIGRDVFNAPILGAFELTEVLMGLVVFAGLPQVTLTEGHVAVTLLDSFFSQRARMIQHVLVNTLCAIALALIAWRLWEASVTMARYDDVTLFMRIPLAPTGFFMSIMTAVCVPIILVLPFTGPLTLRRLSGLDDN